MDRPISTWSQLTEATHVYVTCSGERERKHVRSFIKVKNRKCGQVTYHSRNARVHRAVFSLGLNVATFTDLLTLSVYCASIRMAWNELPSNVTRLQATYQDISV